MASCEEDADSEEYFSDSEIGASSKLHPIRSYFSYDDISERSICTFGGCKIKSKSSNDLYRHVQRKHPNEAIKNDIKIKVENHRMQMRKTAAVDDEVEVMVRMRKSEIMKSCVELTTINGRPLGLVEDSGFKRLMQPVIEAMNRKTSTRLTLNRETMAANAEISCAKTKNQIKKETKNRMISLLIDGVTKHERYFLHFSHFQLEF